MDCKNWSANEYVSTVMWNQAAIFGVNFADGRIKVYSKYSPFGNEENTLYVRYVRGNKNYGVNNFHDNGDGTISDIATNLMWSKDDSKAGMDWPGSLAWVQAQNEAHYLGNSAWRLPDNKELQSIADYDQSPETTNSPALDINY